MAVKVALLVAALAFPVVGAQQFGLGQTTTTRERARVTLEANGACSSHETDETQIMLAILNGLLQSTSPTTSAHRASVHLPANGGIATLVSDTVVCRRIRRAIDSLSGLWQHPMVAQPDSLRPVMVFSVDTVFVALDYHSHVAYRGEVWQVFRHDGARIAQWF